MNIATADSLLMYVMFSPSILNDQFKPFFVELIRVLTCDCISLHCNFTSEQEVGSVRMNVCYVVELHYRSVATLCLHDSFAHSPHFLNKLHEVVTWNAFQLTGVAS